MSIEKRMAQVLGKPKALAEGAAERAQEKRILSLAGQIRDALHAKDREALTLKQILAVLAAAEALSGAILAENTTITVGS